MKNKTAQFCLRSAWKHLEVGILLALAATAWGTPYNVWTSVRLDLTGISVEGKSHQLPNREIAEYECEFTTKTGDVIHGRIIGGALAPKIFVYLPNNTGVFKVKGSGHGVQSTVSVFSILSIWQLSIGIIHLLGCRKI